jgi:hypothetical protein
MEQRRIRIAFTASLLLCGGVCSGTAQVAPGPPKSRVVARAANTPLAGPLAATSLASVTASPGTISFTATDPDLGSVAGSSASTVNWTTSSGSASNTWNLKVHAGTASFTNCATVPTSAVTVTCSSVTGGTAGACKPAITLSTASQQVATGKESASAGASYSVSMNFTLADSWAYIAKTSPACTLTLTYTVTAP